MAGSDDGGIDGWPGGCDPYGLLLAAASRSYPVKVFMSMPEAILIDRDNTEAKRDLMKFVQVGFKGSVLGAGITVEDRAFTITELGDAVAAGSIAGLIDQMETQGRTPALGCCACGTSSTAHRSKPMHWKPLPMSSICRSATPCLSAWPGT